MEPHSTYWSSTSPQKWVVDSIVIRNRTKQHHLLSNYQKRYKGEEVVIGDASPLPISRCDDVLIDNTKFGEALHLPIMGLNLLSIHYHSHQQKNGILARLMDYQGHQ
jgi:hypothetical protein